MRRVRIGIVSPYSLTLPGGVQGQVLSLARTLRSLGHDVRVLGPCDGPPPDPGVTPLGKSLPLASNGSIAPIAPDVSATLRTLRALRDEEFDVVHLHEPFVPGPTQTALLLRPAPIVGTFHAAGDLPAYQIVRPLVLAAAKRIDVRVAVSDDAAESARRNIGGDYELLFNAVDLAEFSGADPTPSDGPTIFFLGRHEERKGLGVLLDAVRRLGPDVRVWIGSDGPQTDALKAATSGDPRIEWLGRIDDGAKAARLAGATVFCAPSLSGESFGVVLLEAMAAGTPVVASDLPGYAKVARQGRDAVLVPPGDAPALAEALAAVLSSASEQQRLVAAGHERAAGFSMEHLARRYLELYGLAIERARHGVEVA